MRALIIVGIMTLVLAGAMMPEITVAQERYQTYEMADGHLIQFKMMPAETKAEKGGKSQREATQAAHTHHPATWEEVVELAESGHQVAFPLSPQEVEIAKKSAAEQASRQSLARWAENKNRTGRQTTVIEMADGHTVSFVGPISPTVQGSGPLLSCR